jgi:hypothetical protein
VQVEALSRALDVTRSRYVITVILAGAALSDNVAALSEICRVLAVEDLSLGADGSLANAIASNQLEDRIRVLLPLDLPAAVSDDGNGSAMDQLARALPADLDNLLLSAVIDASPRGEQAVSEALASVIETAFVFEADS